MINNIITMKWRYPMYLRWYWGRNKDRLQRKARFQLWRVKITILIYSDALRLWLNDK